MKKTRNLLAIVLIVLIGLGWISQATNSISQISTQNSAVKEADLCSQKKLYQKAIKLYEEALNIKENKKVRDKWLKTHKLAFKNEEITQDKYIDAMKKVVEQEPKRTDLWENLIKEYLNKMDLLSAKDCYEDAIEAGADKKVISKYKNTIYYSVSENNMIFSMVLMSSQEYFTVFDGARWGVINPSGKMIYECVYDYAAPVINNETYLFTTLKDGRVYDSSYVAQAILPDKNIIAKAIKENIIPMCKDGVWTFYDYINEKTILNNYSDVSCFVDEKAAVKKGEKWTIINKAGKAISDKNFDDIKMLGTGEFIVNGVMIASVGNKYGIYDESGKSKCDFKAEDMDVCMGGNIAFKDSKGKWGFVNTSGKVVIETKFDEAMSFSNGLAAVKSGDSWGFINEQGELVIEYKYSDGGYFTKNGVCFVGLSNEQMYMISLRFKGV